MPTKAQRAEYSKLRSAFLKRAERAEKAGITEASIYLKGGYSYMPTLKEIKKLPYLKGATDEVLTRDLQFRINQLKGWIEGGTVSLKAYKERALERDKKIIKSLKEAGYKHISKTNLKKFGAFMDEMRRRYGKKLRYSDVMAEFFDNLTYNTKRQSLDKILELWEEFERNGYKPPDENIDLFRS